MPVSEPKPKGKIAGLCALLREDILRGRFEPGQALPPQDVLSKQHGVAEATVSVAIGRLAQQGLAVRIPGRGSFVVQRVPTQQKVLDFVRLTAYRTNESASWVLAWSDALSLAAQHRGWVVRLHNIPEGSNARVGRMVETLAESRGVIAFGPAVPGVSERLCRHAVPVVAVFQTRGGLGVKSEHYPQITYDRRESARLATEHLVSLGYSRIGFIGLGYAPLRSSGFLDAVRQHGLNIQGKWLLEIGRDLFRLSDASARVCRELCEKVLRDKDRPEAFCCSTSRIACLLQAVASDMGLKVPDDLAIIGCDETELDIPEHVPITSVAISMEESCQNALDALEQIVSEGHVNHNRLWEPIVMPLHLTVRDSCGAKLKGGSWKSQGGRT